MEYNIKKTLKQCNRAATSGYKLTKKQYKRLNGLLASSSDRIESTLIEINSSDCYVSEASESLSGQLGKTRELLSSISVSLLEDIEDLHENLEKFSITLFGITMAGKSTLMEVLTEGTGESIGKGSQRTTRDIRSYVWNDLRITDVPGIGAFEGEEDEMVAYEAARKADLILFLITDNGPGAAEAEAFSHILSLGKPIICIVNVKVGMREGESLKMTERNIERAFDLERLATIREQFSSYASLGGQDWNNIRFVNVHLKSAFESQRCSTKDDAEVLRRLSRIDELKKAIIDEVDSHGIYYREKNYVDIISIPSVSIFSGLLFQSFCNKELKKVVEQKDVQLLEWKQRYERDNRKQIEVFVDGIKSELRGEVPSFAEEHYDDKKVDEAWNKVVVQKGVKSKTDSLVNNICLQADDKLNELAREIEKELMYISALAKDASVQVPEMKKVRDAKKVWNWGAIISSGGLEIAATICVFAGAASAAAVLGIIGGAVAVIGTIGSFLFKDKSVKVDEARKKLEGLLNKNIDDLCETINAQLLSILERIITERVDKQHEELRNIINLIGYLSETQNDLSNELRPILIEQGTQLFGAALKLVYGGRFAHRVEAAARVSGNEFIVCIEDNKTIPQKKIDLLSGLVQEHISFAEYSDDKEKMAKQILGENRYVIDQDSGIIVFKVAKKTSSILDKASLAQQFTGLFVKIEEDKNA